MCTCVLVLEGGWYWAWVWVWVCRLVRETSGAGLASSNHPCSDDSCAVDTVVPGAEGLQRFTAGAPTAMKPLAVSESNGFLLPVDGAGKPCGKFPFLRIGSDVTVERTLSTVSLLTHATPSNATLVAHDLRLTCQPAAWRCIRKPSQESLVVAREAAGDTDHHNGRNGTGSRGGTVNQNATASDGGSEVRLVEDNEYDAGPGGDGEEDQGWEDQDTEGDEDSFADEDEGYGEDVFVDEGGGERQLEGTWAAASVHSGREEGDSDSSDARVDGRHGPRRTQRNQGPFTSSLAESAADALRCVTGRPSSSDTKYSPANAWDSHGRGAHDPCDLESCRRISRDKGGREEDLRQVNCEYGGTRMESKTSPRVGEGSFGAHVDRASKLSMAWCVPQPSLQPRFPCRYNPHDCRQKAHQNSRFSQYVPHLRYWCWSNMHRPSSQAATRVWITACRTQ
jgi:hypothetical protein